MMSRPQILFELICPDRNSAHHPMDSHRFLKYISSLPARTSREPLHHKVVTFAANFNKPSPYSLTQTMTIEKGLNGLVNI